MSRCVKSVCALCAPLALAVPLSASAQESQWSLGISGGSLGAGPEVSYRFADRFGVRANAGFLSFDRDESVDDIEYNGDLELNSLGAMFDFYPTGGGFRISFGGRINNNEVDLVGTPAEPVTVGDTVYSPAQVGTLTGTVSGDDFAPAITLGYGGTLAQGFTLGFEIGVMYQGSPQIDGLRATGLLASNPGFLLDIQEEEARIEEEAEDYKYWPVAQVHFLYRF
jgi:hypothetical protein